MTLPAINYETIECNEEFKSFLEKNRSDWYKYLRFYNFDIHALPPKQKQRLFEIYKLFVEKKENWFPAKRASKIKPPVIKRETIENWIKARIRIFGIDSKDMYKIKPKKGDHVHFENSQEAIERKSVEKLTRIFEKIGRIFPSMLNIILNNINVKFVITPSDNAITLGESQSSRAMHYADKGRQWLLFTEKDIFGEEETCYSGILHEIFHFIDYSAVDTSFAEYQSCRTNEIAYSDILNERLGGELKNMAEKEQKKTKEFWNDCELLARNFSNIYTVNSTEDPRELFKAGIEVLKEKHKVWMPIYPIFKELQGRVIPGLDGINFEITVKEIFAKGMQAYFYNTAKLKEYNPCLHDIIEKEVLPDLT